VIFRRPSRYTNALLRRSTLTATCLLLANGLVGPQTHASEENTGPQVSGRFFSNVYVPTQAAAGQTLSSTSLLQSIASLWLGVDAKIQETTSVHAILTGDALDASLAQNRGVQPTTQPFRMGLREAYVQYQRGGVEVRAGRQIIPWGKSDAFNPTDYLTAKDLALLNPDDEVRRIGATSLLASWTPQAGNSPWTFSLVWTPVFPRTKLLVASSVLPENVTLTGRIETIDSNVQNSELALKSSYTGQGWDASVSVFRGWNHIPKFTLVGLSGTESAPQISIGQAFHRVTALGGDVSTSWGDWVFRGETAYIWTENPDGTNPFIEPTHWDSVIGIERPLGSDFRVQGQLLVRIMPRFLPLDETPGAPGVPAAVNIAIVKANALLLGYQDQTRPAITLRPSYSNETLGLEAELFLLHNFMGHDSLLRPKLTYRITDGFKATLGSDIYRGPSDRPLGALQSYNSVFAEAKYTF
jgi:hypothetical protein